MSGTGKLSRRDFLKLFTGNAVHGISNALAAAVPSPLHPLPARRSRARRAPALEAAQGAGRCARCYAPFDLMAGESLCPVCVESEGKQRELMADTIARLQARSNAPAAIGTQTTIE